MRGHKHLKETASLVAFCSNLIITFNQYVLLIFVLLIMQITLFFITVFLFNFTLYLHSKSKAL